MPGLLSSALNLVPTVLSRISKSDPMKRSSSLTVHDCAAAQPLLDSLGDSYAAACEGSCFYALQTTAEHPLLPRDTIGPQLR